MIAILSPISLVLGLNSAAGGREALAIPGEVIISEVAWGGTAASSADEWIELYNNTSQTLDLSGWQLVDGNDIDITLSGQIEGNAFYVLERNDDFNISDLPADQIYVGALNNLGEMLSLLDDSSTVIDTANADGGSWPSGTASPDFLSMERYSPDSSDDDGNWVGNDTLTRNGLDFNSAPINGTPGNINSSWVVSPGDVDLLLRKSGPSYSMAGSDILYNLVFSNAGTLAASGVILTDTLPVGFNYVADDSGLPIDEPEPGKIVWTVGSLEPDSIVSLELTATIDSAVSGMATNLAEISTVESEADTNNNSGTATTFVKDDDSPIIIISEVAWGGTAASTTDEWLELYNNTNHVIDLTGWHLIDGNNVDITLSDQIEANGFYVLERSNDSTISDLTADQIYGGALNDDGEMLSLLDDDSILIDTANDNGGSWPGGSASTDHRSMERLTSDSSDDDGNWASNDTLTKNGLDANGTPINGTPGNINSSWVVPPGDVDLILQKSGPSYSMAGSDIPYRLVFSNAGTLAASDVILTDTLPLGFNYVADDSGLPIDEPEPGTIVWTVGSLEPDSIVSLELTVTIDSAVSGLATNLAEISTAVSETNTSNNSDTAITSVSNEIPLKIIIDAVLYDGYELGDADEAVRLINIGQEPADLTDWQLSDGSAVASFPAGTNLAPGNALWATRAATSFSRQFGFSADIETNETDPGVPEMIGAWPGFSNEGDELLLRDREGILRDALVYEDGDTGIIGWLGASVNPYVVSTIFGEEGQILYRKRDQESGLTVTDTDTAADWAQSTDDPINGRKVMYPGWDFDRFFYPYQSTEPAEITIAIAPDNAYETLLEEIETAQSRISVVSLTFRNIAIAEALVRATQRGVSVTVLLDGAPPGGIEDSERYVCKQLELAGGECWFMVNDEAERVFDRYRFLHAKFMLIDGERVIISSENLSPDSLPSDEKDDGTWGRRGILLITNAPGVVQRMQSVWESDFDASNHLDILRWNASDPTFGSPPPGMMPITVTGGMTYTVRYSNPFRLNGELSFELIQSPENALRDHDSLLGLLSKAGSGDTVLVQQLTERPHWGSSDSNPVLDPNPRLLAYIEAARRGAKVRLLLDEFFDDRTDPVSNHATCVYINEIAIQEKIDLRCALANPTGLGIHNKLVLVHVNTHGFVHLGSINGTELSNKGNREVAIQVQSTELFEYLSDVFYHDWPYRIRLPIIFNAYLGPADHILISEIVYDPQGLDDKEFIELVNPTRKIIDLSRFSLADAVDPADFEDLRRFPVGTFLSPGETIVIATAATSFNSEYGADPDFEILNTNPNVPELIDDPLWGDTAALLQLSNEGDEVIIRDAADNIIDGIAYGAGHLPGTVSCPLSTLTGSSIERLPFWRDTDNCPKDFREWPFPSPGSLP